MADATIAPDGSRTTALADIARRTVEWVRRKEESGLPRASDGTVRLTLLGRCMPPSWLWDNRLMLPVMVAVGAWRSGARVALRDAPEALTGYALADPTAFSEEWLDAALACARTEWHTVRPEGRVAPPDGQHVEFEWLWGLGGYCDALAAQGKPGLPLNLVSKVTAALPERLLRNPAVLGGRSP